MKFLDFYFDFISPFAYLASTKIDDIAQRHGYAVNWIPFRLGVTVTKVMGIKPLLDTPLKGAYLQRDIQRLALSFSIPLCSDLQIFNPLPAQRLFHGVSGTSKEMAGMVAKKLLEARWAQGRRLDEIDSLVEIAGEWGGGRDVVEQALAAPATKEATTHMTQKAIDAGVFGSPTCVVDGELFWGVDRLWLLDSFLANAGSYKPLEMERLVALGLSSDEGAERSFQGG
ncbi:2-hydroxychromene-2-carboxylate isomerase [Pseudomonas aeruginosa]|uniref:2-hydroxychromene-2-carboxylate isomerase n=1 Tax=Pseudomonas aeruginosa TaxID=287 RepID=UPI000EAF542C|nr:2-hydroxychromene-2-carboxylate isomerase [Pseudomonas aeruginosa]EIU1413945.1 2-hydroxychromene-2-carboxylate isomerase [Pseudomonas aeruginosa]MCG9956503.1 2-hydroxychromene-2-carboxylate isomerase [Pseudomonas aeruginosa]RPW10790.1 2-hydroxychromene-2-carboxylate isomerase [Pseudomonas aeruginosa]RTB51802.1 2-hydroxychromene-2-carboxylate isomerase [Pseudomonas aeruginosa]RTC34180.1 2-hydroxychromene-2-carboxylate isomerase [Pseudomonas aeruginosa]